MPIISRQRTLAVVAEDVSGVPNALPGPLPVLDVLDPAIRRSVPYSERMPGGQLGRVESGVGARSASVSFRTQLYGAGGAALYDALLPACGGVKVGSDWRAALASELAARPTVTLYVWEGPRVFSVAGCAGSFRWRFVAGELAMAEWTFEGAYLGPAGTSMPTLVRPLAGKPLLRFGCEAQDVLGEEAVVSSVEFESGGVVSLRPDASKCSGFVGAGLADLRPRFEVAAEAAGSGFVPHSWLLDGSTGPVSFGAFDGVDSVVLASTLVQSSTVETADNRDRIYDRVQLLPVTGALTQWTISLPVSP